MLSGYDGFDDEWEFDGYADEEGDMFLSSIPWRRIGGTLASALASGLASQGSKKITGYLDNTLKNRGWGSLLNEFEEENDTVSNSQEISDEMEYFAELAAEAETEGEADYFLDAIASLAGPLLSSFLQEEEFDGYGDYELYEDEGDEFFPALLPIASALAPIAAPLIGKGIRMLGNFLKEDRTTRQGIKAVPKIAKATTKIVAKQVKAGDPVTKNSVARTMAKQTMKTLGSAKSVKIAKKQNKVAAARAKQRTKVSKKLAAPLRHPGKAKLVSIR